VAKHTPGPWKAVGRVVFKAAPRQMIIACTDANPLLEEANANAALIAAAPDLLAACKGLADFYTGDPDIPLDRLGTMRHELSEEERDCWRGRLIRQMLDAVAKAEGGPQ
jgi:hypothetical protein